MTQSEKNKILDDFIDDKRINWAVDEDGKITITSPVPITDKYKFFLWDGHLAAAYECA